MGIKVLPIWPRFSMLLFSVIVAAQPSSVGRRLETMSGAWDGSAGDVLPAAAR
jgi:hypothetical protein